MHKQNAEEILNMIKPSDLVLDIGGWACPFNRANHVVDAQPYETRGYYKTVGLPASQGGEKEHFTSSTWHCLDICSEPLPFSDKEVDFVICSHVLEDIRDPIWVCKEMVRVAKRGYIEVPSRIQESCRGWESNRIAGLSHHRWLIDIEKPTKTIHFTQKYHMIHSDSRFSFPPSFFRRLSRDERVIWLFWDNQFQFEEVHIHSLPKIEYELEQFVNRFYRPPFLVKVAQKINRQINRLVQKVARRVTG